LLIKKSIFKYHFYLSSSRNIYRTKHLIQNLFFILYFIFIFLLGSTPVTSLCETLYTIADASVPFLCKTTTFCAPYYKLHHITYLPIMLHPLLDVPYVELCSFNRSFPQRKLQRIQALLGRSHVVTWVPLIDCDHVELAWLAHFVIRVSPHAIIRVGWCVAVVVVLEAGKGDLSFAASVSTTTLALFDVKDIQLCWILLQASSISRFVASTLYR